MLLGALALAPACSSLLYQPSHVVHFDPARAGLAPENIQIPVGDKGEFIRAWYFGPRSGGEPKTLTVFFHGNAENLTSHWTALAWLPAEEHAYLIFDYRGYGASSGSPSPAGTVEDGVAAIAYARGKHPGVPLVVFGQSLGGAVALRSLVEPGARQGVVLVVVDSTFHSYEEAGRGILARAWLSWPFQWLAYLVLSDRWAPGDRIGEIAPIPLVVIHGDADPIIDEALGRRVYDLAKDPKEFWPVPGGHHTDAFWRLKEGYRERFLAKLNTLAKTSRR